MTSLQGSRTLFIYVSKASILVGRVSEFRVSLTPSDLAHPPQQEVSPQDAPGAAETPGGVQHQPEPVTEPLRRAQSTALHAASGS